MPAWGLIFLKNYYICVSSQVCNCRCTYTAAPICVPEDSLCKSVLPFYHVGPRDETQVSRLWKAPFTTEASCKHENVLSWNFLGDTGVPLPFRTYTVVEWRFTGWVPGLLWVRSCVCSTWILPSRLFSGRKTRCVACQMPEDLALK